MKVLSSLFLVMSLTTGCGLMKHSKTNASATAPSASSVSEDLVALPTSDLMASPTPSAAVLNFNNTLTEPSDWTSRSGEAFVVIGKVQNEEVAELTRRSNENVIEAGTIAATWEKQIYPDETYDIIPTPQKTETVSEYSNIKIYFTQTLNDENTTFIAVKKEDYETLRTQNNRHGVWYQAGLVCTEANLDGGAYWAAFYDHETVPARCDLHQNCTFHTDKPTVVVTTMDYRSMMDSHPNSGCATQANGYLSHGYFMDQVKVSMFKINFNESMNTVAASANFKAAE
jgi:hypothetical protein